MPQQQVIYRGKIAIFATPISKSDATKDPNTMGVSTIVQKTENVEVNYAVDIDKTDEDLDVVATINSDTANAHDTTVEPQMINVDPSPQQADLTI